MGINSVLLLQHFHHNLVVITPSNQLLTCISTSSAALTSDPYFLASPALGGQHCFESAQLSLQSSKHVLPTSDLRLPALLCFPAAASCGLMLPELPGSSQTAA